ncbi:MAG: prepilin-type N-terminal cleavage/methylation domain-containing protein [Fimbriimonadaceae bacterium]|nr:prepilin-type N-terminal cleavage/methylation domain-containing protein [Fimbriimonadaceae bacterium]QYK57035.1 MAG: prepilin-type N-terminal cleavage/methylation domain-containing protein [Fimbriimonadaceae bacterium]
MKASRGFTLVEIMIVVVIISILAGIAVPHWIGVRKRTWTNSCYANQTRIDQAKQLWVMEEGKGSSEVPTFDDLVPKYLKKQPVCPTGGTYDIGDNATHCTCSDHPHQ